jgi:hypothetical protein
LEGKKIFLILRLCGYIILSYLISFLAEVKTADKKANEERSDRMEEDKIK